ncbi:thiJ/pfpI-family protein-like protein [Glonium stellatum]|uniref:ThiJ/pfpI-family protein-like protein n=1 Tax=Glonium stellatum TaxID=574774 RepID=A0A8E2JRJ7_9PEZI|nr:thiJ/pfpI-family protein-like protein [Glonium stellatum]
MADYGHDPTETVVPYAVFKSAGFSISFATETGKTPECDKKMLTGWTQKLLGANQRTLSLYNSLSSSAEFTQPLAWTSPDFSLDAYQLVFLPGGHEKGVRQVIDSISVHQQLAAYFPQTRKSCGGGKAVAAICHGVLGLSEAKGLDGRSVLYDVRTTALPGAMEQGIFWITRGVLGDYYKTYGAGSESVEAAVRKRLRDPKKQYKNSLSASPFIVTDETYNYVSGRFPPDAQLLAERAIELVKGNLKQGRMRAPISNLPF